MAPKTLIVFLFSIFFALPTFAIEPIDYRHQFLMNCVLGALGKNKTYEAVKRVIEVSTWGEVNDILLTTGFKKSTNHPSIKSLDDKFVYYSYPDINDFVIALPKKPPGDSNEDFLFSKESRAKLIKYMTYASLNGTDKGQIFIPHEFEDYYLLLSFKSILTSNERPSYSQMKKHLINAGWEESIEYDDKTVKLTHTFNSSIIELYKRETLDWIEMERIILAIQQDSPYRSPATVILRSRSQIRDFSSFVQTLVRLDLLSFVLERFSKNGWEFKRMEIEGQKVLILTEPLSQLKVMIGLTASGDLPPYTEETHKKLVRALNTPNSFFINMETVFQSLHLKAMGRE